ncbi:CIA30 family protein [Sulfitobacter guttiformis]|uniref:Complex I intermediate-associated protein 30 (CIA30) n=1 Tax=Sulfitobacter guttiformis TaxID=74349 RepID=A0A420DJ74_9RHOB|nr:CIA30 family protein [Sulfitobacter guttiformis]KIN71925.1 Complex I intermediate-associated protein 30 [Sulfitobacter guttiformis KCTC 32187]RKE94268.1 complex I intermediate-associated protein 30 (CIA30) [Sulfitobacter guttiformis]
MLKKLRRWMLAAILIVPAQSHAGDGMIAISVSDQSRWEYFSDQVMGGVSEGRASFEQMDNQPVLRLAGEVSTANRGGFIQARAKLETPLAPTAQGVILSVRGNDQTYFVHLRTTQTLLPWQFYQASFEASAIWTEVRIPFEAFAPYGRFLRQRFDARSVRSLAIAAFGRDHSADLFIRAVGFY